jgi:hypothetical protein
MIPDANRKLCHQNRNPTTQPPKVNEAFFEYDIKSTPAGKLQGTPRSGMRSRDEIWNKIQIDEVNSKQQKVILASVWLDEAVGAMIKKLIAMSILDKTVIVLLTDHGMIAKGSLFELGVRITMVVRYPPLFVRCSAL